MRDHNFPLYGDDLSGADGLQVTVINLCSAETQSWVPPTRYFTGSTNRSAPGHTNHHLHITLIYYICHVIAARPEFRWFVDDPQPLHHFPCRQSQSISVVWLVGLRNDWRIAMVTSATSEAEKFPLGRPWCPPRNR